MRVAVYYAPELDDPLWRRGCAWLGRNPEAGNPVAQPLSGRFAAVTGPPRRYGFHATLKPPFGLAGSMESFERDAASLAASLEPAALPPLAVRKLGDFAALCLAEPAGDLAALAAACVIELDHHRAPEDPAAKARRGAGLSAMEADYLARWGYPFVLDAWRFHLTLCDGGAATPALLTAASAHFGDTLAIPRCVETLAIFVEPEPGAEFRLIKRLPLGKPLGRQDSFLSVSKQGENTAVDHHEAQLPEDAAYEDELNSLRRGAAALREAVAARDSFIAVAAHELRNPMTPMIGQVERLLASVKTGKLPPNQVETRLESIRQAMTHYIKRATTLLDVSRITSGKLHLELEPVDASAIAREVAASYAGAAHYAGCALKVTAPPALAGIGDRLAIEQVIDNLLSNAIKYGAAAPVAIDIDAVGDQIRIQVRDHGGGIPLADRERIFQRFEQAVQFSERRSGFGVGLWVVSQLVRAMKGAISVGDAPGGGSLFTVTLPHTLEKDQA